MKKFILPFILITVMMLASCRTEPVNTTTRTEGLNFLYYRYNDTYPDECVLDVYRKDDTVKRAVIMIYGSAWMGIRGVVDRDSIVNDKDLFLNNGYHVVNMDHRRIKIKDIQPTYIDMINDVKDAIQYIKDNADLFKIDTSNIILYGYSSGAHVAELYSYSVSDSPIPVRLCIAKAGVSDFTNHKFRECDPFGFTSDEKLRTDVIRLIKAFSCSKEIRDKFIEAGSKEEKAKILDSIPDSEVADPFRVALVKTLLGIESDETDDINVIADSTDDEIQRKIKDVSPLYHVKNKTIQIGDKPLYTILLHGEKDTLVDCSMSKDLHKELEGSSQLFLMPNAGHDLLHNDPSDDTVYKEFEKHIVNMLDTIKTEPIHLTATHY
ncbi:MAG: hypothetical protein IKQ61_12235 [Spirochaetales bacterium]|nr:hypothetical protein [Spirochaetales bacterium]